LSVPCAADLYDACHILFGHDVEVSVDFLRYLRPSGLKSAYRRKAMETHPDRAMVAGENECKLNEHFKKVNSAYERLRCVIGEQGLIVENISSANGPPPSPSNHRTENKRTGTSPKNHFYTGQIPSRKLYIGQFLYYSGIISWQTLIEAITYQRQKRPLIGQIALNWGMLSNQQVHNILKERHFTEKFGEVALRKQLITTFELMALLGKQKMFQCPLGDYFIKKGILQPHQLEKLLKRQQGHNLNFINSKWK